MIPYYVLLFAPMLVAVMQSHGIIRIGAEKPVDPRKTAITVFFFLFLVLLMFRDVSCGIDTVVYQQRFSTILNQSFGDVLTSYEHERGFYLLNKIVSLFTSNFQWFLIVTALLSIIPLWYFYKKEAEIPVLTMVLFVTIAQFSMYFSGIRQVLGMAFAIPAWYCAKNKKLLWFILLVFSATLFHRSAIVLLALYPLYHARITQKWLIAVVPAMATIYIFNRPIFNILSRLLGEDSKQVAETGAYTVLILLILFAVYAFIILDENKAEPDVLAYRNLLLLAIVIQCFVPLHPLAMRMNYYFLPFVPILIPKVANRSKVRYQNVTNLSVVVLTAFFALYFFVRAYTSADILHVYPYVPFWQ